MKSLYIILEECINSKTLDKLVDLILDNYKQIINIKNIKYNFNITKFNLDIYSKLDYSDKNIILMFRLLEKKFYKLNEKKNKFILKYTNEISNNNSNNQYNIIVTDKKENLRLFKAYLIIYYLNLKFNNLPSYLGVDCEFNTKKIALIQINFEQSNLHLYNSSLIFLFDPKQLSNNWILFFIQKILCNLNCYKILHGPDSLDLPYIFRELLHNDYKYIEKFTSRLIDTKYLCEYKYFMQNKELGKCKINNVLKDEGIITNNKYESLLLDEKKMGPIYDIIINVNNMSTLLIKYAMTDVLWLPHLVDNFKINIKEYSLIVQITQYIMLEKFKITNNIPYDEINKINNYIIITNNGNKLRLNDVFRNIFDKFIDITLILRNILKINYFKKTLIMFFKFIFFVEICNKFTIYSKISQIKILYHKNILKYKFNYPSKLNQIITTYKLYINRFLQTLK